MPTTHRRPVRALIRGVVRVMGVVALEVAATAVVGAVIRAAKEGARSPWATPVPPASPKRAGNDPMQAGDAPDGAGFADDEVYQGYLDGCDANSPQPSGNRSASYRHGFANARDDLRQRPRAMAETLRRMAEEAKREDNN